MAEPKPERRVQSYLGHPTAKQVCLVMIKPQKSNLDNLIVVLVWFVLYIEDTFSPRMPTT